MVGGACVRGGGGVGPGVCGGGRGGVGWVACCVSPWEKFGNVNSPEKQRGDKEVRIRVLR